MEEGVREGEGLGPVKRGVLWKRKQGGEKSNMLGLRELLRPWQRRFFVLSEGRLAWFVHRGDSTVRVSPSDLNIF